MRKPWRERYPLWNSKTSYWVGPTVFPQLQRADWKMTYMIGQVTIGSDLDEEFFEQQIENWEKGLPVSAYSLTKKEFLGYRRIGKNGLLHCEDGYAVYGGDIRRPMFFLNGNYIGGDGGNINIEEFLAYVKIWKMTEVLDR